MILPGLEKELLHLLRRTVEETLVCSYTTDATVGSRKRQKLQVSSVAEVLPCDIFRSVWCNDVDWGYSSFCMTLNFLKTLIL